MGHYGNLPEVDPEESDAGIANSIRQSTMRRPTLTPSPSLQKKSADSGNVIEVKADIEPVYRERLGPLTKSVTLDNYSVSIDLGPQEQAIAFFGRDLSSPQPASMDLSVTPPDIPVPVATPERRRISKIHRQSQVVDSKLPSDWSDGRSHGVNFSLLGDEVVTEDGKKSVFYIIIALASSLIVV